LSIQIIKIIKPDNPLFPESLKRIPNPPRVLYLWGSLDLKDKPVLAVVGTRRCSDYGKRAVIDIVSQLTEAGFFIVSGLAKGIDSLAHKTAIEKKGKTIAVLGSGIDRESIYPRENLRLAEKIIETGGAVISEFPAKTPAFKSNFPKRNRIISGLSWGVLVIEAKEKSGALITASYAFSQKRKVFAVPGSIYSPNSKGCHLLIKRGAKLVEKANDILSEFNLPLLSKKLIKGETKEETLILKALDKEPLHIDKIIEITKLSTAKVISTLANLEIKGKVKNLGGNIFTVQIYG
jgi:DNA processing protein